MTQRLKPRVYRLPWGWGAEVSWPSTMGYGAMRRVFVFESWEAAVRSAIGFTILIHG